MATYKIEWCVSNNVLEIINMPNRQKKVLRHYKINSDPYSIVSFQNKKLLVHMEFLEHLSNFEHANLTLDLYL